MSKKKFYILTIIACLSGYIWLAYAFHLPDSTVNEDGICLFKNVTGLPCPSCGTTRAVILLSKGQFLQSILLNPIGIVVAAIMFFSPFWIIIDLLRKNESLYVFYKMTEEKLRKKSIAVTSIVLIVSIWIWNIYKGL